MITTQKRAEQDNRIMKLLEVKEIRHHIALTDKGELTLMLRLNQQAIEYRFVLDAVPVSDEINDQLKELFNR